MGGSANPNMVQSTATPTNPYQVCSRNDAGRSNLFRPFGGSSNMTTPYQQQVVDATIRDVGSAAMGLNRSHKRKAQALLAVLGKQ